MTDYLTQCNAITTEKTVEKNVWRWAKHIAPNKATIVIFREDDLAFSNSVFAWPRTEYDGDADGNPIPAMLGPQELWDKYKIIIEPSMMTWTVYRTSIEHGLEIISAPQPTYDKAITEANRIAGGGA